MFSILQNAKLRATLIVALCLFTAALSFGLLKGVAVAQSALPNNVQPLEVKSSTGRDVCGSGKNEVKVSVDLGCKGTGNPIYDMLYAVLRFMSVGVGVVLIGSMVFVGMQYSFGRGDPNTTAKAKTHMLYIFIALITYMLAYAGLNYLIPGGVF